MFAVQPPSAPETGGLADGDAVDVVNSAPWSSSRLRVSRLPDAVFLRFFVVPDSWYRCCACGFLVRSAASSWCASEDTRVAVRVVATLLCIQFCCCSCVFRGNLFHSSTLAIRTSLNSSSRGLSIGAAAISRWCWFWLCRA
jgi:hypothetical protein